MVRCLVVVLLTGFLAVVLVGCAPKPPDTSTFPSPYTYPTAGQPPEPEETK